MRIRDLALELYRAQKQVRLLEEKLQKQGTGMEERNEIEMQLRRARMQRDRLKAMLEGAKAQ
jgi:hypothetical protein